MTTLREAALAWIACVEHGSGSLGRIAFWIEQLGDKPIADITEQDVDLALVALARRGKLKAGRGRLNPPIPTGQPLAPASINRFISTLAGLYKNSRKLRLLPRSHTPPTQGIEKLPETVDPDNYFRPEEVEKLLAVATAIDQRWKKLPALILLGFHTGLRVGNLLSLRWQDVDLERAVVSVSVTKNGRPHVAALTPRCVDALSKLLRPDVNTLVCASYKSDKAFNYQDLWRRVCAAAGFSGRTFHWLRHGCGSALAANGVSQAQIMAVMGHRTLRASARYMHCNVEDRRAVVDKVFS